MSLKEQLRDVWESVLGTSDFSDNDNIMDMRTVKRKICSGAVTDGSDDVSEYKHAVRKAAE